MDKEWLIRRAKRHYIGPFDAETVKQLIRDAELGPYDEVSRSGQGWYALKDCPPFNRIIEEIIPHAAEEKTIRLTKDEITSVTKPGAGPTVPSVPRQPAPETVSTPRVIDLEKKPTKGARVLSSSLYTWVAVIFSGVVFVGVIWVLQPSREDRPPEPRETTRQGTITEPKLKALSETFQQFNLLFYQGKLEESAGQYQKAIQLYKQALRYHPKNIQAKVRLVALEYLNDQNIVFARKKFLRLLASRELSKTDAVDIQNYLGLLSLKTGQYTESAAYFLEAIRQDENFAPAHFNLGYSFFFRKQYHYARKHFDRAVQLQPNMPIIYIYLGRSLQKLNQDLAAVREYTNANRINPNLQKPHLYLSFIYFKLKQRSKSIFHLTEMIKLDPEYDHHSYKDPRYMHEKLSYGFIIQAYNLILKQKKTSSALISGLALLHFLDGRQKKGYKMIKQAIRKNREDALAHTIYGYMLQKNGQYEKALSSLRRALRYEYRSAQTHLLIAEIDIRLGRYQKALEHCRKVLSFEPFSVKAYYTLGVALSSLDRTSESVDAFNKALEYDPNYIPAKKMLLEHSK